MTNSTDQHFRRSFDTMSNAVAIWEAVEGSRDFVFLDFNPAAERIEGITRSAVIGRRLDGNQFPIEVTVGETLVRGKRLHVGIVRDATATGA